jgi:hypothetical protein
MNDQSISDKFAAIVVASLLIITAWGNAMVMLIVSALGLVVFALISGKNISRGGALAATIGFVIAIAISLVMLFW